MSVLVIDGSDGKVGVEPGIHDAWTQAFGEACTEVAVGPPCHPSWDKHIAKRLPRWCLPFFKRRARDAMLMLASFFTLSNSPSCPPPPWLRRRVWYDANCHCGAVKYKIKLPNLDTHPVNSCNCSICTKLSPHTPIILSRQCQTVQNGHMLVYLAPSEVISHTGYDTS